MWKIISMDMRMDIRKRESETKGTGWWSEGNMKTPNAKEVKCVEE
jgi:hypothetical protein